ncbi:M56 family metallopeptidase [Pedobacter montanisoli]|uniref:M48 family metalloprotease n=1 Tax=Pedobacter montanisoli TaxID=2923277 RepID=A0ABS9ZW36_9SPHI|nr:M56 family metallopeptidase [Pedobacter montanisoli]MCJ0742521.1 M48 family metalloprotease [Pedobacter montanisoli]
MEAIVHNLVKALGWSILHSLWQGAAIFALLCIGLVLCKNSTARLKHNLAFGSLALIFVSFCITFFSLFKLPGNAVAGYDENINAQTYYFLLQQANSLNFKTERYFPYLTSLYSMGIILQLFIILKGYLGLKSLKKAENFAVPSAWQNAFENTVEQLNIRKKVTFYLSPKVNVPLVIGFFKPVVLFPVALATQLDIQQVEAILIHELSHIRRNDYLINLMKVMVETLLFFNPFVWLTSRFIQIEREHACDDLVVNFTNTPVTYAHALLKLELIKNKQKPNLSLAAADNNYHLYQRIKRITNMKTNYINVKQQLFILTLTIGTIISVAWINPTQSEKHKTIKAKSIHEIKSTATETKKPISLVLKADTDTTKKKKRSFKLITTNDKGETITYTSLDDVPDSMRVKLDEMKKRFESPEWKEKMAKIEFNAKEMEKKFNSKEWKDHMAKIELNAKEMEKKFNSKEWKDKMAKIEFDSKEMEKKFNSKEWKDHMAKIEFDSKKLEEMFNSKEWKDKMAKIEFDSKEMEKKFNSKEWKDHMAKIELNAKEMEKKFNSKEWKDHMAKIEFNGKKLEEMFNSKEWKDKMEEIKKFQQTPEYKELRKKYEKDLEELKKQKGISGSAFFFESSASPVKLSLPAVSEKDLALVANLTIPTPLPAVQVIEIK